MALTLENTRLFIAKTSIVVKLIATCDLKSQDKIQLFDNILKFLSKQVRSFCKTLRVNWSGSSVKLKNLPTSILLTNYIYSIIDKAICFINTVVRNPNVFWAMTSPIITWGFEKYILFINTF